MTRVQLFVLAGLAIPSEAFLQAQPTSTSYCAIEVVVKSPEGARLQDIPVEAVSDNGKYKVRLRTNEQGIVQFCDPPMESYVEINVGVDLCSMTIHRVFPTWRKPLQLSVLREACGPRFGLLGFCDVVLRLRDNRDHPLEGVKLIAPEDGGIARRTSISDGFGRLFITVRWNTATKAQLQKAGFVDSVTLLECDPNKGVREEIVVLKEQ